MMREWLADLDELVLHCRGANGKAMFEEAVACYRARAFRSSIVATWIAVVYDILDKLEELQLAGNGRAEDHLKKFENARKHNNFRDLNNLEDGIVKVAREDFELLTNIEEDDLKRLKEDRNRCAHPSYSSASKALPVESWGWSTFAVNVLERMEDVATELKQEWTAVYAVAVKKRRADTLCHRLREAFPDFEDVASESEQSSRSAVSDDVEEDSEN